MSEVPGFTAESSLEMSRDVINFQNSGLSIYSSIPAYEWVESGFWPYYWWPFVDETGKIVWRLINFAEKPFDPLYPKPATPAWGWIIIDALIAVLIGLGLGYKLGMWWQGVITPKTNYGKVPTGGCAIIGPNPQRQLYRDYWGCERSMALTINEAEQICASSTICTGNCPSGAPCTGTAIIRDAISLPGVVQCGTQLFYKCACGC